jgi:hypothetical protein
MFCARGVDASVHEDLMQVGNNGKQEHQCRADLMQVGKSWQLKIVEESCW